jgi:hypothetical protein
MKIEFPICGVWCSFLKTPQKSKMFVFRAPHNVYNFASRGKINEIEMDLENLETALLLVNEKLNALSGSESPEEVLYAERLSETLSNVTRQLKLCVKEIDSTEECYMRCFRKDRCRVYVIIEGIAQLSASVNAFWETVSEVMDLENDNYQMGTVMSSGFHAVHQLSLDVLVKIERVHYVATGTKPRSSYLRDYNPASATSVVLLL